MWHMPDDATEGVAEQLQLSCSVSLVHNVLPRMDEGLGKPSS